VAPCSQWSIGNAVLGTLMRHDISVRFIAAGLGLPRLNRASADSATVVTNAPALCASGVGHPAGAAGLVAALRFALRGMSGLARAASGAVALAAVAVAAQHNLHPTPYAHEQTGWTVHAHPDKPKVLDGFVPGRHTAVAPPSSARCRARRGSPQLTGIGIAAAPTCFGNDEVVPRSACVCHGPRSPHPRARPSPSLAQRPAQAGGVAFALQAALGRPGGRKTSHALERYRKATSEHRQTQNRHLAVRKARFLIVVHRRPRSATS